MTRGLLNFCSSVTGGLSTARASSVFGRFRGGAANDEIGVIFECRGGGTGCGRGETAAARASTLVNEKIGP